MKYRKVSDFTEIFKGKKKVANGFYETITQRTV